MLRPALFLCAGAFYMERFVLEWNSKKPRDAANIRGPNGRYSAMTNDTEALRGRLAELTSDQDAETIMRLLSEGPRWADNQAAPDHLDSSTMKFALAEHRHAYASWTVRNGVQQNHAVFLRHPNRINGKRLTPNQFIFVDGWEKHPRADALHTAYLQATGQEA